jgi:hypothetical protein
VIARNCCVDIRRLIGVRSGTMMLGSSMGFDRGHSWVLESDKL